MYKAELLRLKQLHGDVSSRAQHLQMELFNCQQEAGRLAQSERDRVVLEHRGSEALLRSEIASLENRCAACAVRPAPPRVATHVALRQAFTISLLAACAEQSIGCPVSF